MNTQKVNDVTNRLTNCSRSPRRDGGDTSSRGPPSAIMTDFVNTPDKQSELYQMIAKKKLLSMANRNHLRNNSKNQSLSGIKQQQ